MISLVKYAGEFWVTLADFSATRSTEGYSNAASVKSAIRTLVVRQNPDSYIAFRGEAQIKNIIQENKRNPMFVKADFEGHTRTALIHFSTVAELDTRFDVNDTYRKKFMKFMTDAEEYISKNSTDLSADFEGDTMLSQRSNIVRYIRSEIQKLDKEIEIRQANREKLQTVLNTMETLELEAL